MTDEVKPKATIVSATPRSIQVPLKYPVEFDGKVWDEVMVRRVSGKEVETFVAATINGEAVVPPMIECPLEVFEAMDDDDRLVLEEAAVPFSPRRFALATSGSIQPNGEDTSV